MIVADSNVIVRGIRSREGASGFILRAMLRGEIGFALSASLVMEYEDVLGRPGLLGDPPIATQEQVGIILDALCSKAALVSPWFRYRPFLDDPKDDLVVECALAAGAGIIVTDDRHFRHPALAGLGIKAMSARDYAARLIEERKRQ